MRDHGPGLPPGDPNAVFERFWRDSAARGRDDGGAGLGLAIVAALVNAHGGTVDAANPPGGGALFTVRLPAARRPTSPAPRSTLVSHGLTRSTALPAASQVPPRFGRHGGCMESATHPHHRSWNSTRLRDRLPERLRALPLPRPELAVLLGLAALLYLWALSKNGWANDYYSAAVRSMAGSWHDFLYGSFDAKGLMTVDKPPLALWVEALSVKVFGFNSLAILVPQALMGVASVGLLYDLTRRRWGRAAGTVAGLALALTPVVVAISRHNNPDALLVLCSVGALWCFVRALEQRRDQVARRSPASASGSASRRRWARR